MNGSRGNGMGSSNGGGGNSGPVVPDSQAVARTGPQASVYDGYLQPEAW